MPLFCSKYSWRGNESFLERSERRGRSRLSFVAHPPVISEDTRSRCFVYFKGGVLIALIDCRDEGNKVLLSFPSVICLLLPPPFLSSRLAQSHAAVSASYHPTTTSLRSPLFFFFFSLPPREKRSALSRVECTPVRNAVLAQRRRACLANRRVSAASEERKRDGLFRRLFNKADIRENLTLINSRICTCIYVYIIARYNCTIYLDK